MPAEGSPTDVPPAAFGRYRALHQIGVGSLGPVFHGEDPATGHDITIHLLRVGMTAELGPDVANGLLQLRDRLPRHDAIPVVLDAGLHKGEPYYVTPLVTGDSLDRAFARYGPAAIVDAVARLRQLANALDRAAQAEIWHGALQPQDIVVSAEDTALCGLGVLPLLEGLGVSLHASTPYTAPEIADGRQSSAAADQYALAAIAYEWLFGYSPATPKRPEGREGPASPKLRSNTSEGGSVDLPSLPGVSRERLASAFTVALAPEPADRFQTSGAFVAALSTSVRELQPQGDQGDRVLQGDQGDQGGDVSLGVQREMDEPAIGSLRLADDMPEPAGQASLLLEDLVVDPVPEARVITDLTLDNAETVTRPATPVMWQGAFAAEPVREEASGYSPHALAAALVVGIGIGIAGGYWLGSRRGEVPEAPGQPFTDAAVPGPASETARHAEPPAIAEPPVVPAVREAVVERPGRLLVRTSPAGARVTVDGVERGQSPLALRDLGLGTHTVSIMRSGSAPVERSVTLTADRPSRTLEESLRTRSETSNPPSRPDGRFGVAGVSPVGSVFIASRPAGASVTIDGRPAGTTPLTVPSLSAGSHAIRLDRPGYRPWTTTVQITEGARARVAASLVGGQAQE